MKIRQEDRLFLVVMVIVLLIAMVVLGLVHYVYPCTGLCLPDPL